MWNNVRVNPTYGQSERNRRLAREAKDRRNFFLGLILAPILIAGWVPVVWIFSKIFK
jgi:hypothetical protein